MFMHEKTCVIPIFKHNFNLFEAILPPNRALRSFIIILSEILKTGVGHKSKIRYSIRNMKMKKTVSLKQATFIFVA